MMWLAIVLLAAATASFATQLLTSPENLPANFNLLSGPQAAIPIPFEVIDPNPDAVRLRFYDPPLEIGSTELNGTSYSTVRMSGEGSTIVPGEPDVPRVTRLIMIGNTGNVNLIVTNLSYTEQNNIYPAPVQALTGDGGSAQQSFTQPNSSIYSSDGWFPENVAEISNPATVRDVRFVVVTTYPVQINPVTGQIRVYDNIEVLVENIGGIGENEILLTPSSITPSFKKIYSMFENFHGSSLDALPVFPGDFLVIGNNDAGINTEGQRLANFYKRKGVNAAYVTTAVTGTSALAIRNYISALYTSSGALLEFVTILGDEDGGATYGIVTDGSAYDNYYGILNPSGGPNPDPVPDLAIGRLPSRSLTELNALVTKTINYQTPADTNDRAWLTRGWCAAHTDYIPSNQSTKEYTRQIMLGHGINPGPLTVYPGAINPTDVNNQLALGISVFNDRMSWIGEFYPSDLSGVPTTYKLPFVAVFTCGTGSFNEGNTLSEEWVRPAGQTAGSPKGAIGCVGVATLSTHVPFNNILDAGLMYGLYVLDIQEQGAALVAAKLQLYKNYWSFHSSDVTSYCSWTNLMGDAAVPIWRKTISSISATYPSTINLGTNNVSISVVKSPGSAPVVGALVCLWKGTETYSRGYTDAAGQINLPATTTTTGYMQLTVSKDDIVPKLDSINVVNSSASLAWKSTNVDDDNTGGTSGNTDHILNPGETIDLNVKLRNAGTSATVTGISGVLSSTMPGVQVTDGSKTYPNIAPGDSAYPVSPFRIHVSAVFNNEPVALYLDLTSSVGAQRVRLDFTPSAGNVAYVSNAFSGPGGNIDPGETGNLTVTFQNSGARSLVTGVGILRSLDPLIFVGDSNGTYGTITAGSNGTNSGDPFNITVSSSAFNGRVSSMTLIITDANGLRDSVDFTLTIGTLASTSPTGPDGYGYYAYDNTETTPPNGACTYSWIEIAPGQGGPGTSLNLIDNAEDADLSTTVILPFNFVMYGSISNRLTICTNGWCALGTSTIDDFRNYRMGTPIGPPYQIAGYWDDLATPDANNNVYTYYDATNHYYVVEWRAKLRNQSGQPSEIFEIILYDPAFLPTATGDGKIKVQYNTVNLLPNSTSNDNDYASVGIQNSDHSVGLDYHYWNTYSSTASASLVAGRAIMYTTDASGALITSITVGSPNGGENWYVGQAYNITWTSVGVSGNVNITINRTYPGVTWESLFSGTANDGAQLWTTTSPISSTARIRVVSANTPTIGDTSNANLSILMPTVSLLSPNGGELWPQNSIQTISWNSTGLGAAKVELNRSYPGVTWEILDASNGNNELGWDVTGPPTTTARIRVSGVALPSVGDTSSANFTIGTPPVITHTPHADAAAGPILFTAIVTDDVTGFTTKLFYKLVGAANYDSATFAATVNPDEFSVTTGSLAEGYYQYYLRCTDAQSLSTFSPTSGVYTFDAGNLCNAWISFDDGSAENYNWVDGPDFQWAVKFTPTIFPFALCAAKFAVCPTRPDATHVPIRIAVLLANGPGGLPGTVVWSDTTGTAGNVLGGLPTGPAWSEVVIRSGGAPLSLSSAFYLSVMNTEPRDYPESFGTDTSSTRAHTSYFYDACDQQWYSEDAVLTNARPGNRMIRASGFSLVPPQIVIRRVGVTNDVTISWNSVGAPYYKVYRDTDPNGTFATFVGSTSGTSLTDTGTIGSNLKMFYRVVSSDSP
jgi:hypothetical protein